MADLNTKATQCPICKKGKREQDKFCSEKCEKLAKLQGPDIRFFIDRPLEPEDWRDIANGRESPETESTVETLTTERNKP